MDCRIFAQQADDWLDGRLDATGQQSMQRHLESCPGCSRAYRGAGELRAALRVLPAPAVSPHFAEAALAKAAGAQPGRSAVPMALAASLVMALGVGAVLLALRPDPVQTVVLTVRQPESVRLVFNAATPLPGATISLRLPENVELVGYGARRELTWQTDLSAGANLLRLPLVVNAPAGGELVTQVSHGSSSRTFRLRIKGRNADAAAGAWPARFASL